MQKNQCEKLQNSRSYIWKNVLTYKVVTLYVITLCVVTLCSALNLKNSPIVVEQNKGNLGVRERREGFK